MRNKKRKIRLSFLCVLFIAYYLMPRIVVIFPQKNILSLGWVLEYRDGHTLDGEPTVKQMEAYMNGPRTYSILREREYIYFPIFVAKDITEISIGGEIYNLPTNIPHNDSELKEMIRGGSIVTKQVSVKPLVIKTNDLYFFRIYAEFTENARFEKICIKKYPWSKKEEYTVK